MKRIKAERLPVIDMAVCTHCGKCIAVCPTGAIEKSTTITCAKCIKYCMTMDVPCNPEHYMFIYEKCDACGICIEECPHQAIYWFEPKASE
jgi:ferredoxin